MSLGHYFKVYENASHLPKDWDSCVGSHNRMLSSNYLFVLDASAPSNVCCKYVGLYVGSELVGGCLLQHISLEGKGVRSTNGITRGVNIFKRLFMKAFSSSVLFVGNNMLSGHHGFYVDEKKITLSEAIEQIEQAIKHYQQKYKKALLIVYKDFEDFLLCRLQSIKCLSKYHKFSAQPNMVLDALSKHTSYDEYISTFSKKYRARARSARRKKVGIVCKEMTEYEIHSLQEQIYSLYNCVVRNASFNTFLLASHHMLSMKQHLKEHFRFFGYFDNDQGKLVAFYSLICNESQQIESYFLGYDHLIQKERQLYLNMLFDMITFAIDQRATKLILGRTALEIKSTVGAIPYEIYGLVKHRYGWINRMMPWFLNSIETVPKSTLRNPFK